MKIAQLSDFHFTRTTWNPFRLFSKRLFGTLNWIFKRKNEFSEAQLAFLPSLFQELNIDLVLLGGDFTSTALPQEFRAANRFAQSLNRPWIAIPGNHDHYTFRAFRQKHFYRTFPNTALERIGLEVRPLAPSWWLISLDTAIPTLTNSQGLFSPTLERSLEDALTRIPPSDSVLLFNHYPFFSNDSPNHRLQRGDALEALIQRHPKIRLYLHGHTHRHTLANLQANHLPLILDSGSIAHTLHGTWNLLDLSPTHCHITAYHWQGLWHPFRQETIAWDSPPISG